MAEGKTERSGYQVRHKRQGRLMNVARVGLVGAALIAGVKEVSDPGSVSGTILSGAKNIVETLKAPDPSFNNEVQEKTFELLKAAREEGQVIRVRVINAESPQKAVNMRKTPAVLGNNFYRKVKTGEAFEAILVTEMEGYQKGENRQISGIWAAVDVGNGRIGFINSDYVQTADGTDLIKKDRRIYRVESGASFVVGEGN